MKFLGVQKNHLLGVYNKKYPFGLSSTSKIDDLEWLKRVLKLLNQ